LKSPYVDNTLPHLYYKIANTIARNKNVLERTSERFVFLAWNVHSNMHLVHFKLSTNPYETGGFHHELSLKKIC